MKQLRTFIISFCVVAGISVFLGWKYFGPVRTTPVTTFVVPQGATSFDVPRELYAAHLIRNESVFRWLYGVLVAGHTTSAGGYRLDGTMTALGVIRKLLETPDFIWVTVREGLRKEQIGILLHDKLGWSKAQELQWNNVYNDSDEYREGVYFPDTYLLPRDETASQIAKRFIDHFNEKFAPFASQFAASDVKWTTGIKIASLIQREAGGSADMPIIAGVIWNRLNKGMALQIDATLQYIKGNAADGWWPVIRGSDTSLESPYNTYLHKGLPTGPIASSGLAAIAAAANPATTDCLYYLHDHDRQIHCAVTYAEHLLNIKKYLE